MADILTCREAAFSYENRTVAENISFTLKQGDYLCVVGPNGSGKSTLVKGIVGLKAPYAGSIAYGDGMVASDIGYLPQQTELQRDFPASVKEVVLSGTRALFYTGKDRRLAEEKLEQLEILPLLNESYRDLSGGQRQRVLLARALCAAKRLIVLDEPVSGLDPLVTEQMYQIIARENRRSRLSVVMVSHDVNAAMRYADRILHLDRTPEFFGSTADYGKTEIAKGFMGGNA